MKHFFKDFCREKRWGVGEVATKPHPPHPEREGVAAKINRFSQFSFFYFFPFVITMTMFLKYLRHKVGSVKCFTFNLLGDQFIGQIKAFHTNSL